MKHRQLGVENILVFTLSEKSHAKVYLKNLACIRNLVARSGADTAGSSKIVQTYKFIKLLIKDKCVRKKDNCSFSLHKTCN
jgi:hypothetical protein